MIGIRLPVMVTVEKQDRDIGLIYILERVHAIDCMPLNVALNVAATPQVADALQARNPRPGNRTFVRAVRTDAGRNGREAAIGIPHDRHALRVGDAA